MKVVAPGALALSGALAILAARAGVGAGGAVWLLLGALVVGSGLTQSQAVAGDAHRVVQVLPRLVGLGATSLAQKLATRMRRGGRHASRVAPPASTRRPSGPRMRAPAATVKPSRAFVTAGRGARQGPPRPAENRVHERSAPPPPRCGAGTLLGEFGGVLLARIRLEVAVLGPLPGPDAQAASLPAQPIGRRGRRAPRPAHLRVATGRPTWYAAGEHATVLAAGTAYLPPVASPIRGSQRRSAAASDALAQAVWGADRVTQTRRQAVVVGLITGISIRQWWVPRRIEFLDLFLGPAARPRSPPQTP